MISLTQESEALARRLADLRCVSVEDAIQEALEERARAAGIVPRAHRLRDASPEAIAKRLTRFNEFARQTASMPVIDPRPVSEIVDDLNAL